MVIHEVLVMNSIIDAHQHRELMGSNLPNAFV